MKAQFLKIAKVKDEKAFYKKYPTEAAFFKAHPEAKKSIKKAQIGMSIPGSVPGNNPKYVNYQDVYNDVYQNLTGVDVEEEQKMQRQAQLQAQALKGKGGGEGGGGAGGMQSMLPLLKGLLKSKGGEEGGGEGFGEDIVPTGMDIMGGGDLSMAARYGRNIPKAQVGGTEEYESEEDGLDDDSEWESTQATGYSDPGGPIDLPGTRFGRFADKAENVIGKALPIVGPIMSGFDAISQKKQEAKAARQAKEVSGLGLIASTTQPEKIENKYTTPWDVPVGRNQLSKSYGVGTNILTRNGGEVRRAQDGSRIGGNPTEIQNTYAPGYLYDDLGYEPLNDSNQVKKYEGGGAFSQFMNEEGGAGMASGLTNSLFDNSGESQIGSGMGQGIGMLIPGVGSELGGAVGGILGGVAGKIFGNNSAERDAKATQRNIEGMAMNNMASKVRSPYTAFTKNGGNVNPQLINRFGNLTAQDFAEFAHQDEFRAGGHLRQYRNPSEEAMQTYKDGGEVRRSALNGEVQTTWGGGVRTLSHNPYMPSTGETIEFVGNSHDTYDPRSKQTGIGVKYGQGNQDSYTDYAEYGTEQADANVEVEKEPAAELIDPKTGEKNLTVYGNLKIPNQFVSLLGDDKAKGKKFKNYVSDLSKQEEKENKKIATSTNLLNNLDVKNSFDRLKLSSLEASINGANMKLKTLADRKIKAADIQNAINETAEEYGILADDLARGKFKIDKEAMQESARDGKSIPKAQNGLTFKDEKEANDKGYYWTGKFLSNGSKEYKTRITKTTKKTETSENANALSEIPKNQKKDPTTGLFNVTPDQLEAFKKKHAWYPDWDKFDPKKPETIDDFAKSFNARAKKIGSTAEIKPDDKATGKTKYVGEQFLSADFGEEKKETPEKEEDLYAEVPVDKKEDPQYEVEGYKRNKLADLFNQILPFIRPSDQEAFNYAQLYPEMNALANNQLEPVQAQGYQPDLKTPIDISYQDMLNANQADYNSTQKMFGYNPAAQTILNAQKYSANEKVLGEEFRQNQQERNRVFSENIDTLNTAKQTNLNIFDRQYGRKEEALSNTKATTQAALNSVADKIAKNKLENRTLGIYENLYNYRYDNKGRAINMNPLFQPNMPYVYGPDGKPTHKIVRDSKGNVIDLVPIVKEEVAKKQNAVIPSLSSGPIVPQGSVAPTGYVPIDEEEYTNEEYMNQVAPKKNGGKLKNKYVQSSIVRGFK